MRIFAADSVVAKSRFWYYLRKLNKVKRAHGEILACTEVNIINLQQLHPRNPTKVKFFGIVTTYKSKFGHHTSYKEFRATNENTAVSQLCKYNS